VNRIGKIAVHVRNMCFLTSVPITRMSGQKKTDDPLRTEGSGGHRSNSTSDGPNMAGPRNRPRSRRFSIAGPPGSRARAYNNKHGRVVSRENNVRTALFLSASLSPSSHRGPRSICRADSNPGRPAITIYYLSAWV